jgi:excinuclease ABC subunit B
MPKKLFEIKSSFKPKGDQPKAIESLTQGILSGEKSQVLLGVTGSGKTFTMANVIQKVQKPTLILAHNKTLAAQLYQEFKEFFPDNCVEYFVSYYDYFQPEAYIPRSDTYIEKDLSINDRIERLRLSATRSLVERDDVIVVSSVSCIYGLGMPDFFRKMNLCLIQGQEISRDDVLMYLVEISYSRNDIDFPRGSFRARGDVLEIFPGYEEDIALRVEFFGDEIEKISEIDSLTGRVLRCIKQVTVYPASHHVTSKGARDIAAQSIKEELNVCVKKFADEDCLVESQRLLQRTRYDLEMIKEIGSCKGIENYSRHFTRREVGEPPPCLLDYFPEDFLLFADESHQTIPQIHGMHRGDHARKKSLVEFGFRLPSAYDNRPLTFDEFHKHLSQIVYVSATPAEFEIKESQGIVVEQVIRPTGLLDPIIEIRPQRLQVDDVIGEIQQEIDKKHRVLVTTLTKRLAEELTDYLQGLGVAAKYLHSDIDTLERIQIIQDLRRGHFDVLVGINLLREGLDIPEVALVAILDADKQGFLRSATALIQTCGRAARNVEGRVIMYADRETPAIKLALEETDRRRKIQKKYNEKHGIVPTSISKEISNIFEEQLQDKDSKKKSKKVTRKIEEPSYLTKKEICTKISEYESKMQEAARDLDFEQAALFRDLMKKYQDIEITIT